MPHPWTAELEVSAALAKLLVEAQFPELAPARVELLGVGWDNTAWLVNDQWVFRFPRRKVAVELIETECRLLPWIAPRLPLPIPVPQYIGQPGDTFPWPFAGYRLLPGRTACRAGLDTSARVAAAEPLACFLKTLHAIPADEAAAWGAGADLFDRVNVAKRRPKIREQLSILASQGLVRDTTPWLAIVDAASEDPLTHEPTLVHGDFYVRHVLVDEQGCPSGVIDWGDVHLGSPAVDLAIAHSFLPAAAREAFRRAYGPIDPATWRMARFRALDVSVLLARYGHETGDEHLVREALVALGNVLDGE